MSRPTTKIFKCSYCDLSFRHNECLGNHLSKHHLDEFTEKNDLENSNKHNCILCERNFKFLRNLRRHERICHGIISQKSLNRLKCSLCKFATSEKKDFSKHIETTHGIKISTEEYTFQTVKEFNQWKEKVEKETISKYIKKSGVYKGPNNSKRHYYECHRSGFFVPSAKGKKSLKAKGSKKINGTCPSSIKLYEAEDGTCKVKFTQTHVGHESEIFFLDLSESEKKSIAKDIVNKVPFDEILNKIRDSATDSSIERIHLLTRKDLHNIKRSLNMKSIVVEPSDGEEAILVKSEDQIVNVVDDTDTDAVVKECDGNSVVYCDGMIIEECEEQSAVNVNGTVVVECDDSNVVYYDGMIVEEYVEEVELSQDQGALYVCEVTTTETQDLSSDLPVVSSQNDTLNLEIVNDRIHGIADQINTKAPEDLVTSFKFTKEKETIRAEYLNLLDSVQTERELEILEQKFIEIEYAIKAARLPKIISVCSQKND